MKDQVLSIDQMRHLRDLNIDTSKASLYWVRHCHGCKIDDDSTGEWFLSLQKEFQVHVSRYLPNYNRVEIYDEDFWCISKNYSKTNSNH